MIRRETTRRTLGVGAPLTGFGLGAAFLLEQWWARPAGIVLLLWGAAVLLHPLLGTVAVRVDAGGIGLRRMLWTTDLPWSRVLAVEWEPGDPSWGPDHRLPRMVVVTPPRTNEAPWWRPRPRVRGLPSNVRAVAITAVSWSPDLQRLATTITAHAPGVGYRLGPYTAPARRRR